MVDVAVLLLCVKVLRLPTPVGAGMGVGVGSTLTFFANRRFAFRDQSPEVGPQFLKFAGSTAIAMVIHATLVGMLADRVGINVVLAKLCADVLVFSVGQLLILRYIVFPRKKT